MKVTDRVSADKLGIPLVSGNGQKDSGNGQKAEGGMRTATAAA
jgi:hypothetical protein